MICKNCGAELQSKAKFCPKCGWKVEVIVPAQPSEQAPVKVSTQEPAQTPAHPAVQPPAADKPNHGVENIWPEWKIEKQLGKGSYGTVYKAIRRDNNLTSYSAIKVISIPQDQSEVDSLRSEGIDLNASRTYFKSVVNDFVNEIQLMQSFKGTQNIVSVEDYKVVEKDGAIGWDIYIRMELLTPFSEYICDKKLNEKDVIKLGCDICTALEMCAQKNIIHRDIKPDNIFVNDFGFFKLGDFGIARTMSNMTNGMSQKGTPFYMAPEVFVSNKYDARVDVCSLGIVMYKLMNNNRLPFIENDQQLLNPNAKANALERRRMGEPMPAPSEASPEMAHLILKACDSNPDNRFSSASEMKFALSDLMNGKYDSKSIKADSAEDAPLDSTVSVRKLSQDPDQTVAVHHAPEAQPKKKEAEVGKINTPKKKNRRKAPVIAAIVVILALIAGCILALPLFKEDKDNPNEDTTAAGNSVPGNSNAGNSNSGSGNDSQQDGTNNIQSYLNDADKFAQNNNLTKAIEKIKEGLKKHPDSAELKNKLSEYESQQKLQNKQSILNEAKALSDEKDYLAAMNKIGSNLKNYSDDVDMEIAYDNYKSAYENDIIMQGDSLVADNQCGKAVALVKEAQKNVDSSDRLATALANYEAQWKPVTSLSKLQHSKYDNHGYKDNSFVNINGKVTSYLDNVYSEGLLFRRYNKESSSIFYDLNEQYTKLSGNFCLIKAFSVTGMGQGSQSDYNDWYVDFIGDGETLYTTPLSNVTVDLKFNIDVTDIIELEIKIRPQETGGYYMYDSHAMYRLNRYIALTDLNLYQ